MNKYGKSFNVKAMNWDPAILEALDSYESKPLTLKKKKKRPLDTPVNPDYNSGTMNDSEENRMMGTSYVQSGNVFRFNDNAANQIHPRLPAGNYIVQVDMTGTFFLERVASFDPLGKLYGDVTKNTNRIISTFLDRPSGTGVLLTGEKGSGKTMLAKNVVREAAHQHGIPTLVINQPLAGDRFNKFIQSIGQEAIIFLDEFEKVYDAETQEAMLTLLDGSFPSKKLFILTCNDKWRVNEHMRNRPGRIFYSIDFDGLKAEFIREYAQDTLKNKEYIEQLVTLTGFYTKFNFDMLKAIVEEMNRYDETPQEALSILNAKVEYSGKQEYTITMYQNNKLTTHENGIQTWTGNPISGTFDAYYDMPNDEDPSDPIWNTVRFGPEDLIALDPVSETTTYSKGEFRAVLKRKNRVEYDVFKSGVF